ncbi:MAG TPA: acyl-CoA dehydrogenase family protein, partial [Candidatus Binataceae bacterium]|nr:acyl-CoA dehydrogenase family protein [Candidatus Binataceae bacterium]
AFNRKLGAQGWIGLHWPRKYGGGGRTLREQLVVVEELARRYACILNSQSLCLIPSLLVHGTEAQKIEVIPRIVSGEIEVSLGYTEPNAGSDLASVQMRAIEKDDHFIISGEKIFNTMAHWASYHWLLVRTDVTARPKHRGLTMFLVDMNTPGITVRPIETIDESRTNLVHYDDVKVPRSSMVGEQNRGFYVVMEALGEERLLVFNPYSYRALFNDLVEYAKRSDRDGYLLAANPIAQDVVADLDVRLSAAELLYERAIWLLEQGLPAVSEISMFKLFMSETGQELVRRALGVIGLSGLIHSDANRAVIRGLFAIGQWATIFHTFGAGASELMRNLIAIRRCGLPAG